MGIGYIRILVLDIGVALNSIFSYGILWRHMNNEQYLMIFTFQVITIS